MKNLNLKNKNLKKLPDNLPKEVAGWVDLSNNNLTSLDGCPKYIADLLWVKNNPNLKLVEILKYILNMDYCSYIQSDYNFDFVNNFIYKDNHERIKLIFEMLR